MINYLLEQYDTAATSWSKNLPWAPDLGYCVLGGLAFGFFKYFPSSGGGASGPGPGPSFFGEEGATLHYPFGDELVSKTYLLDVTGAPLEGVSISLLKMFDAVANSVNSDSLYPGFPHGVSVQDLAQGFPLTPCYGDVISSSVPMALSYKTLVSYLTVAAQVDPGLVSKASCILGMQLMSQAAVEGIIDSQIPVMYLTRLLTCSAEPLLEALNPGLCHHGFSGRPWWGPAVIGINHSGFYPLIPFKTVVLPEMPPVFF